MGAVVSCVKSIFRTIGNVLHAIVNGISSVIMAIIGGIAAFLNILISFLTCGYAGKRRGTGTTTHRHSHRTTRTSRI